MQPGYASPDEGSAHIPRPHIILHDIHILHLSSLSLPCGEFILFFIGILNIEYWCSRAVVQPIESNDESSYPRPSELRETNPNSNSV